MKIVIAGAGEVGFHLAQLLAYEQQDITLIDSNQTVLDNASTRLDVRTINGDCSVRSTLIKAGANKADLVLSLTTSEKTNLVTALFAKNMGAKKAIARVHNQEYLQPEAVKAFNDLGIDSLISPNQLAAKEISRLLDKGAVTDYFEFEDGLVSLLGLTIHLNDALVSNRSVDEIENLTPNIHFRPIAILRRNQTIIPDAETIIRKGDHVYFIIRKSEISEILRILGKKEKQIRSVMINGGSDLGYDTAMLLQRDYSVTLIEKDEERCKWLAKNLKDVLVVNCLNYKIDQLREEGLAEMDAFVSVTDDTQVNILTSLLAGNVGVYKTVALVDSIDYTRISQNIGVDTIINKKLIAANNIFRHVRKGKIVAITGLHGLEGEIIEFMVYRDSNLTSKTIKEIKFPKGIVIGTIVRDGEAMFPSPDMKLVKEDKVIIFAMQKSIAKLEKLFR